MAIYHQTIKALSRAAGRSSVAASAYRAGVELIDERTGLVHDFTRKRDVIESALILPGGGTADRAKFWNAVEAKHRRRDAVVAREVEVALPAELSSAERRALAFSYAQELANRYGVAADVALHMSRTVTAAELEKNPNQHVEIDPETGRQHNGNWHAHILLSACHASATGDLGKKVVAMDPIHCQRHGLQNMAEVERSRWAELTNEALARAELDFRVDHRSFKAQGIALEPTQHLGPGASAMARDGLSVERARIEAEAAANNARRILARPEIVLDQVSAEKSVFSHQDVARALHRYVPDDQFQAVYARALASPELVTLAEGKYATRSMIELEARMARTADTLRTDRSCRTNPEVTRAILAQGRVRLSAEQQAAVLQITGSERLAVTVGFAGAGKSTMMHAARQAWERVGYRVHGVALAGKAAEALEESSGIVSLTIASRLLAWETGRETLSRGDVLVVDEAGMVDSPTLAKVLDHVERAGAKVVLVGDPEQLQPIGPGAAFRAVVERCGDVAHLTGVRRQHAPWQREASRQFGQGQAGVALAEYDRHGHIHMKAGQAEVVAAISRAYLEDLAANPQGSRLVLAHRNQDVQALNAAIRDARKVAGHLDAGIAYQTAQGLREFAPGDRLLFRENHRGLGVKNGQIGTVMNAEEGRLTVQVDDKAGVIELDTRHYTAFEHGYAATIHKSQGATVDRVWVAASPTMDRHLAYVAMTRHRDAVTLYGAVEEFSGKGDSEQAKAAMLRSLGQGREKATTLDYRDAYAGRRGLDPIVVPQDVQKVVQAGREREAGGEHPVHEALRGMSRDELLMDRMRNSPRLDYEREQFVAGDAEVARLARGQQLARERDALGSQRDQVAQRLRQLESAGWLRKLSHGQERKQLRGEVVRLDRQIEVQGEGLQALGLDRTASATELGRRLREAQDVAKARLTRDEAQRQRRREAVALELKRREGGRGRAMKAMPSKERKAERQK
ncbi:MAG: Ti-type conjugative transfer relaxase TraA [Porticoccaceae bacterium]|nr:Ti-type conjugative transfer relaxase TraA [Porticoccaceae bacterium]